MDRHDDQSGTPSNLHIRPVSGEISSTPLQHNDSHQPVSYGTMSSTQFPSKSQDQTQNGPPLLLSPKILTQGSSRGKIVSVRRWKFQLKSLSDNKDQIQNNLSMPQTPNLPTRSSPPPVSTHMISMSPTPIQLPLDGQDETQNDPSIPQTPKVPTNGPLSPAPPHENVSSDSTPLPSPSSNQDEPQKNLSVPQTPMTEISENCNGLTLKVQSKLPPPSIERKVAEKSLKIKASEGYKDGNKKKFSVLRMFDGIHSTSKSSRRTLIDETGNQPVPAGPNEATGTKTKELFKKLVPSMRLKGSNLIDRANAIWAGLCFNNTKKRSCSICSREIREPVAIPSSVEEEEILLYRLLEEYMVKHNLIATGQVSLLALDFNGRKTILNLLDRFYGSFGEEFMRSRDDRGLAALATTDLADLISFDESCKEGREAKRKFDRYRAEIWRNKAWGKQKDDNP